MVVDPNFCLCFTGLTQDHALRKKNIMNNMVLQIFHKTIVVHVPAE